jgi:uncharacterized membrane protein
VSGAEAGRRHRIVQRIDRLVLWIGRHWLATLNVLTGVWVGLPWLAPVFMHIGATEPARLVYAFYSVQCHQLPQRSYFLFGGQLMLPLKDILGAYPAQDPLLLRPFIGTAALGWKVAWSDRMVSLYTPLFVGGVLFALGRWQGRRWGSLPVRAWALAYVPLAVDGLSHLINDVSGLGFRDTNAWLAVLTGHALPAAFYACDALGSFNWWMRLLTGLLAGFATVWALYPRLDGLSEKDGKHFVAVDRS